MLQAVWFKHFKVNLRTDLKPHEFKRWLKDMITLTSGSASHMAGCHIYAVD